MDTVGVSRIVQFWLADVHSVPVTTYTLANLSITFTRDHVACSDTLTLTHQGSGLYYLQYTPTAAGRDVIQIDDNTNDLHYTDVAVIDPGSDVVAITQNTPTTDALKVTAANPADYTLYVYDSNDWVTGNSETYSALGSTQIDASGNWVSSPIYLTPGTYHIVIRTLHRGVTVIKPFLQV